MAKIITNELRETLEVFENPKFFATHDETGEPNIALVMTWAPYEGNTLVYGDFMTYKTRKNLEHNNPKIGILVMTMDLDTWMIHADFESFHRNDEIYEFIAQTPLFRYNQYTNARSAGVANAVRASSNYRLSKISVLLSYIKARLATRGIEKVIREDGTMPRNVLERVSAMTTVKMFSFVGSDGYPQIVPAFGMYPVGTNRLVVDLGEAKRRASIPFDGQRVAISIVSLEPAAFQMKGTFTQISGSKGLIDLDRVYTCSLPRPGLRVDRPLIKKDM